MTITKQQGTPRLNHGLWPDIVILHRCLFTNTLYGSLSIDNTNFITKKCLIQWMVGSSGLYRFDEQVQSCVGLFTWMLLIGKTLPMVPTARLVGFFGHPGHNVLNAFIGCISWFDWNPLGSMKYMYLVGTKVASCLGTITKAVISNYSIFPINTLKLRLEPRLMLIPNFCICF